MRILISNDDGVNAPGLLALANALSGIAEIKVVAPDRDRSGASNSLTLTVPLRISQLANGYISVAGTPTDCVHLALTGLFAEEKFDIVVSGINDGSNLGDDVFYSGTVAAAMEGRILGLPAIAISLSGKQPKHYKTAAAVVQQLIERVVKEPLPASTILNVNVPDLPINQLAGIEVARLGKRHAAEPTIKEIDPRGYQVYWVGLPGSEADAGAGTDFYTIRQNKASVTPLIVDMTHYHAFEQLSKWVNEIDL